jgi:hypothetical protein
MPAVCCDTALLMARGAGRFTPALCETVSEYSGDIVRPNGVFAAFRSGANRLLFEPSMFENVCALVLLAKARLQRSAGTKVKRHQLREQFIVVISPISFFYL